MELISRCGIKADLHIHSSLSFHKDGKKVNANTLSNLDVLVDKLVDNCVNICAITDHDAFSFSLYNALKEEEENDNCIKKVLPGVEFSVEFIADDCTKVIHIITIFDDSNSEKVKNIETILQLENGKAKYDSNEAYSESMYLNILKQIGLDTVLIAHQKNSLLSCGKEKKNDVSTLGEQKFNEFLFFEYFEAYEFRNKKNELFNKKYIFERSIDSSLRMITGSDCHCWSKYPNDDDTSNNEFAFTYIKCLPCFKGLVMAVTGSRRIKLTNSFFNPTEIYLEAIEIKNADQNQSIPLSPGINVIIGDNSVGKSLLLHKLFGFRKVNNSTLKKGYEKYLRENRIEVSTGLSDKQAFRFDTQGEVRRLFEEGLLKTSDFLEQFFPPDINPSPHKMLVEAQFQKLYTTINDKFEFDRKKHALPIYRICYDSCKSQSLTFHESLDSIKGHDYQSIIESISEITNKLATLKQLKDFEKTDVNIIDKIINDLSVINDKYLKKDSFIKATNKKINSIKTSIKQFKTRYSKQVTDEQKIKSDYLENLRDTVAGIVDLFVAKKKVIDFKFDIHAYQIEPMRNEVFQYAFISKLNIEEISNSYLNSVISKVIKKGKTLSTKSITPEALRNMILYCTEDAPTPLEIFKQKVAAIIDKDFQIKRSIIENDMDVYKELSDGLNAQIYFTLITGETKNKGIYIIDQPEDHVSPKAINEYLLDKFKDMGEARQVIIVTHNPQFIVNLDIDNVVFLSKTNKQQLKIVSGALEYENGDVNILQIVADNIEGGLNTIARRMKRYEKGLPFEI